MVHPSVTGGGEAPVVDGGNRAFREDAKSGPVVPPQISVGLDRRDEGKTDRSGDQCVDEKLEA